MLSRVGSKSWLIMTVNHPKKSEDGDDVELTVAKRVCAKFPFYTPAVGVHPNNLRGWDGDVMLCDARSRLS